RMGFDGVWTFEAAHNPFLPLLQAVSAAPRLEVGTNIAVAFARSPFAMAQVAWDLQKASGGRFHLGLGTQVRAHVERRFSMPFDQPARRITDYIHCVRAIWDTFQNGTMPSYKGEFYQFQLINPLFNPGPIEHPQIPIYLAGVNPRMCRAAGAVADGFHVHPMHSLSYLREVVLPEIDAGASAAGRVDANLTLFASVFAITGANEAERSRAEREVRQQVAFYASTPNYRVLLEHHGFDALGRELSELMRRGELAAMAAKVPDGLLEEVTVTADFERLGGLLRRRYEGLLDRVSLYAPIPEGAPEARWREFVAAFRVAA
ncbi:MAG TPA: TIGR03617 family F420-dependent LLM class oxidoreductase, partial [Alphaproteobacteria bacterium]|nr:TIGR03617 family F420-dependent LLM class oxidoreductase [Alphaproteobacteria bacterium]